MPLRQDIKKVLVIGFRARLLSDRLPNLTMPGTQACRALETGRT